jgi:hypothetical protein
MRSLRRTDDWDVEEGMAELCSLQSEVLGLDWKVIFCADMACFSHALLRMKSDHYSGLRPALT